MRAAVLPVPSFRRKGNSVGSGIKVQNVEMALSRTWELGLGVRRKTFTFGGKSGRKKKVWEGNFMLFYSPEVKSYNPTDGLQGTGTCFAGSWELCFAAHATFCVLGTYFFASILANIRNIFKVLYVVVKLI